MTTKQKTHKDIEERVERINVYPGENTGITTKQIRFFSNKIPRELSMSEVNLCPDAKYQITGYKLDFLGDLIFETRRDCGIYELGDLSQVVDKNRESDVFYLTKPEKCFM